MAFGYHHFVVIFNKAGSGDVFKFPIDGAHTHVTKSHPIREQWPELMHLRDFGVAVVDNKVYFIGGYNKEIDKWTDTCLSFNPKTHEWKQHAPMTTPREKFAITTVGKKIFVAGGERASGKATTASEMYDTQTNEWTRAGLIPRCRVLSSACTVNQVPYMSGGYHNDQPKDNIWMNERHYTWTELDEDCPQRLSTPTAKHCMVSLDDKIYFIGGTRQYRDKKTLESTNRTVGTTEALQVNVTTGLDPNHCIVPRENTGIDDDDDSDSDHDSSFWRRHDVICPWELQPTLADMLQPRHSATAVVLGRRIYVFGGVRAEGGDARLVEYLDVDARTWHEAGTMNRGEINSVAGAVLVFADPQDKDYELQLQKRRDEDDDEQETEAKKYRWILW